MHVNSILDHYEANAMHVKAAENWSDDYKKQPDILSKLIAREARIERNLLHYFKQMGDESEKLVNWNAYSFKVMAAEVNVIVNDDGVDEFDGLFISTVFEDIAFATSLGAISGEQTYNIPLGLDTADAAIQKASRAHVANLIGKRLSPEGLIVDNPKSKYSITDQTRQAIRESINTSISLGENVDEARVRLAKNVRSPARALMIAQTETVNAFQGGLTVFGEQSGAIGKVSQNVGAVDKCAAYTKLGPVPINYLYDNKYNAPAYHPRCRCGRRLIYRIEAENNPKLYAKLLGNG